jgi:HEAT repeat protein
MGGGVRRSIVQGVHCGVPFNAPFLTALALVLASVSLAAAPPDLKPLAYAGDWNAIKALGKDTLPALVGLYRASNEDQKASIAYVLYNLGWKSEEARGALMEDVHTENSKLRLQVQWALGRVSDDPSVVEVLLQNLQKDGNPLFRDKAACALAYDQIHLAPAQKIRLYEGLIQALDDPKDDVRRIAALALQIQTGQTKGYNSAASPEERRPAVESWKRWLLEYRAQY